VKKSFLFFILILGFVLRLYKIDIPLADHHSWRQADTAAVARNYIKEGWNFFLPKIDNMVPLDTELPNDQRLFLVEPPVYNSLVAGIYSILGVNIKWARTLSLTFSLGSIIFLYLIAKLYFGEKVALLSALFFAVLPFNVFYSRVVLPEPMIIFLTLGMFYFCLRWLKTDSLPNYILFVIFSSLSFSQKSFPLFLNLPIFYLIFRKFGFSFLKQWKLYLWVVIAFLPIILWRVWISRFPEGIPSNAWLFNKDNIRFKGAFFYWIFAERIGKPILGYWGTALLFFGIIVKPKKEGWFFHLWLLSLLIFATVFAAGSVTHDYYQVPLIPIFCIFLGKGSSWLLFENHEGINKFLATICFFIIVSFSLAFSWYDVRGFYNIQGGVDLAGMAVDELTPKNSLVITGDSNDATLLYNTNRWGWTAGHVSLLSNTEPTIKDLRERGASVYVTTKLDRNSEFGEYMLENYPVLQETNQYIIFSLVEKLN